MWKHYTSILFNFFSEELLSDLVYRSKINIDVEQNLEEVMGTIKKHLLGQRSIVLARYNLFTRRRPQGENFEDWYFELRRLYDLAKAKYMERDNLLTDFITTCIRDEKVLFSLC